MKLKKYIDISKYAEILRLTKFEILFCVAYFVLALIICLHSTPRGSLFSPDSISYMSLAENIYRNHNLLINGQPIYPALIAVGMGLGLNVEQSAGLVPIICYSLLGFPLFLLGKTTSRPIAGYITCIICLICGKYLLYVSTYVWTEMAYVFISVIAMLFFVIYNKYGSLSSITFAGIFALLATLTRNVGLTLILAGIIVIIVNNKGLKKSLIPLMSYCLISIIPVAIWVSVTRRYTLTTSSSNPPLDVMISQFWATMEQFFYNDYKLIVLTVILFIFIVLIYIFLSHHLTVFVKDTIPLTSYVLTYSITMILLTSSFWISINTGMLSSRTMVPIYPYIPVFVIFLFIYICNIIKDRFYKIFVETFSIILLICLVAQGANSLYIEANTIRTGSITDHTDRDRLSTYISEHNLTTKDKICLDFPINNWADFYMEVHMKHPDIYQETIGNTNTGATILDNLTRTSSKSARSLADLIKENKNLSIYIIIPYDISQNYLKNSSKEIVLSNPYKFSSTIIYKADLRLNDSYSQSTYIIRNSSSIDELFMGDFMDLKHDQLLLLGVNSSNMQEKENYMKILDFNKGFHANIKYDDRSIRTEPLAPLLTGDFLSLGYSQLLYIDRNSKGDRMVIKDFSQEMSPAIIRYSEVLGDNSTLKGLFNLNNTQLAGDFQGLGHSQVLVIDHNSKGGKLAIVDFRKGKPYITEISEIGDDLIPIASLLDHGDLQFDGDFMGLGYSQVLFINRNHTKVGNAKIIIVDFSKAPPSVRYLEKWGEDSLFGGWLDANDTQLVGDFMGLGHSQVLFVNHHHKAGKITIADFSQGKLPASSKIVEDWDKGIIFQGWLDINDTRVAGDFAGLGHDQVLFLNSSLNGVKATIVDFKYGMPIPL